MPAVIRDTCYQSVLKLLEYIPNEVIPFRTFARVQTFSLYLQLLPYSLGGVKGNIAELSCSEALKIIHKRVELISSFF